jgi:ATP-dependent Clp protease ATP-binding subunit ClpC
VQILAIEPRTCDEAAVSFFWGNNDAERERFKDYTLRAQKAVQLANQEAHRLNSSCVGTDHLLLGLVKEGVGVASLVLRNAGCYLGNARTEIEAIAGTDPNAVTSGKLAYEPELEVLLDNAADQTQALGHSRTGTGHLLLALLSLPDTRGLDVLMRLSLDLETMQSQVLAALSTWNWLSVESWCDLEVYGPCPQFSAVY